jgi:uncharacterized membrane protein YtjA (UPF0391 family)
VFGWAVTFLAMAIVSAILGIGGVAGLAAWVATVLFLVGLSLFVLFLLLGRRPPFRKRPLPPGYGPLNGPLDVGFQSMSFHGDKKRQP